MNDEAISQNIPKSRRRYEIVCPDCGEIRTISYLMYKTLLARHSPGRCSKCGLIYREARKKPGFVENNNLPKILEQTIKCCGCTLKEKAIKKGDNIFISFRCKRYLDCANAEKCLDAVEELNWMGFVANGKGFERRKDILI